MSNPDVLRLDVKLLTIFCAVAKEGAISRAAKRLNVSQPLVSHALDRLRIAFGDPLFVRAGRGIVPTERALSLAPEISEILDRLQSLTAPEPQDLTQISTRFCLAAFDYERRLITPGLLARILRETPLASLRVIPSSRDVVSSLRARECDLAITPISPPDHLDIYSAPLFEDEAMCFFDPEMISADEVRCDFSALPHASVRFSLSGTPLEERIFEDHGITRNVKLEVSSFEALPSLMRGTRLIAILPSRLAADLFADFAHIPPPCPFPTSCFNMVWHKATHHSLPHQWFRAAVRKAIPPYPLLAKPGHD